MNDLEQIKRELSADLLEEGSWGDLAKKFGTQMKNYAFHGSTNPAATLLKDKPAAMAELAKVLGVKASKVEDLVASNKIDDATKQLIKTFFTDYDTINQIANDAKLSPQSGAAAGGQSPIYQKIVAAAKQFSTKFIADFKKIVATLNDPNLTAYADKFAQVTLTEMMANPSAGAPKPKANKAKSKVKGKKSAPPPLAPPAKGGAKGAPPAAPSAPAAPPAPKPQMPPEFVNLKKSLNDFIIGLAPLTGVNASTAKDALEGVIMSNQMNVEEKKKLKAFIQKHLQLVKYLRSKLNKQPAKPAAAATATPAKKAPAKKPAAKDSGNYAIEEKDKKKLKEYSTVENWRCKGQPVLVAFFNSATGRNDVQRGTIKDPQNSQVVVGLDNPSWKTVTVPWEYVRPIAIREK